MKTKPFPGTARGKKKVKQVGVTEGTLEPMGGKKTTSPKAGVRRGGGPRRNSANLTPRV